MWPIHPRTRKKIDEYGIELGSSVTLLEPLGYFDFIHLQANSALIMTDSGGIQEEACMLRIPCVTLRQNTERPETVEVGANVLIGRDQELALEAIDRWFDAETYDWANPFGDGTVATAILDIVLGTKETNRTAIAIDDSKPTVAVIGQGYMGLPIAALIADAGNQVTGVDINPSVVDQINQGRCPFDEDGLPRLISRVVNAGALKASIKVPSSDIYLVAVPTPHKDRRCDLTYVKAAIDSIAEVAVNGQLVIIESTISPKTTLKMQDRISRGGLKIDVVHCPERAIPGNTLHELVTNDRIIGAPSEHSANTAERLYRSFVRGNIFHTSTTTAECVKLIENTSRDVQIAFANELAEIAEELELDINRAIDLANRHPRVNILEPGPGVGGHCIPIDPWFLVQDTKSGLLIRQAREANDNRPHNLIRKILSHPSTRGAKKIALLGVSYKKEVDDCRETPALQYHHELCALGYEVKYYDPYVTNWICPSIKSLMEVMVWADVLIVVTNHDAFRSITPLKPMFDTLGNPNLDVRG
jgi:UDP-N-acetylglucosamine 2-epimerase (non-hydrolysing)